MYKWLHMRFCLELHTYSNRNAPKNCMSIKIQDVTVTCGEGATWRINASTGCLWPCALAKRSHKICKKTFSSDFGGMGTVFYLKVPFPLSLSFCLLFFCFVNPRLRARLRCTICQWSRSFSTLDNFLDSSWYNYLLFITFTAFTAEPWQWISLSPCAEGFFSATDRPGAHRISSFQGRNRSQIGDKLAMGPSLRYKMTSRPIGSSSWSSTHSPFR